MNYYRTLQLYEEFLKKNKIYEKKKKYFYESTIERLKNWTNIKFETRVLWYKKIVKNSKAKINFKNLNDLDKWVIKKDKKEMFHESKKFFSIIGVSIENAGREIDSWDQPFIKQKSLNGGIIGLIRKKKGGIPHYLIDAKFEPGNYNKIQLSTSVQATYSNIQTIHEGKCNKILKYYFNNNYSNIFKGYVTEDGGRFYKKRNLHWIINTKKNILKLPDNFKWLTLWEIDNFIKKGSYVSPHLRAILSLI